MDPLNRGMFRAYDIRTPSERLTDELAERLAKAEAVYFRDVVKAPGVVVAHDARLTGPRYLQIGIEAFARAGLRVEVIPGVCSTSLFYFAAMQRPECAAVMYGASHNPSGDTGQKLLAPGVLPIARHIGPEGGLDAIEALYVQGAADQSIRRRGAVRSIEPFEDYIQYSMRLAGVEPNGLAGLRLLHDYMHGAAGREMMAAFQRAGAELAALHFVADGRFPLGDPNPVKQDVIAEALGKLRSSTPGSFLLACIFDGDGDRLDVYRGDAAYLSSSFVYAGVLPRIVADSRSAEAGVYADLKSNPLAVAEMARAGVRVEVIRNGHSQIKAALSADDRMLGAVEESAHFYQAFRYGGGRYCTENTLYFALLVARAWRDQPDRFEHLFQLQQQTAREREWGYRFPSDEERQQALEAVAAHFQSLGAETMTHMPNGEPLEATMMRRGLPFRVEAETRFAPDWLQVCQRISQSEDGLARWEVVAATRDIAEGAKSDIARIVARYGAGEEYQG